MTKTLKKALLAFLTALCVIAAAFALAFMAGCSNEEEPAPTPPSDNPGGNTPGGNTPGGNTPSTDATYSVDVYLQSDLASFIQNGGEKQYAKSDADSKQNQTGTVGDTVSADTVGITVEGYVLNAERSAPVTLAQSGSTLSLYFDAVMVEYSDVFEGDDLLYTAAGNLYLKREGLSVKQATSFSAQTGYFDFDTDGEFKLQGQVLTESFYYFKDTYNLTFAGTGDLEDYTLKIESPNKVTYTNDTGDDEIGEYQYNVEFGAYDVYFDGEMLLRCRLDVASLTFVVADGVEGVYQSDSDGVPVTISLDGFGKFFMTAFDSDGSILGKIDGDYTYDSENELIALNLGGAVNFKITSAGVLTAADQYAGAVAYANDDDRRTGDHLAFDGFGNVTITKSGTDTAGTYVEKTADDIDFTANGNFSPNTFLVITDDADEVSYYRVSNGYNGWAYSVPTGSVPFGRIAINGALTLNEKACGTADTAEAFLFYDGSYAWLFVEEDDGSFSVASGASYYFNYQADGDNAGKYKLTDYSLTNVYFTFEGGALVPQGTISIGEAPEPVLPPQPPVDTDPTGYTFDIKDVTITTDIDEKIEVKTESTSGEPVQKAYYTAAEGTEAVEVPFTATSSIIDDYPKKVYVGFYSFEIEGQTVNYVSYSTWTGDNDTWSDDPTFTDFTSIAVDLYTLVGNDKVVAFACKNFTSSSQNALVFGYKVNDDYVFVREFYSSYFPDNGEGEHELGSSATAEGYNSTEPYQFADDKLEENGIESWAVLNLDSASHKIFLEIENSSTPVDSEEYEPAAVTDSDGNTFFADGFGKATLNYNDVEEVGTYEVLIVAAYGYNDQAVLYKCDFEGVTKYISLFAINHDYSYNTDFSFTVSDTLDEDAFGAFIINDDYYYDDDDYYAYNLGTGIIIVGNGYLDAYTIEPDGSEYTINNEVYGVSASELEADVYIITSLDGTAKKSIALSKDKDLYSDYDDNLFGVYQLGQEPFTRTVMCDGEEAGSLSFNGFNTYSLTLNGQNYVADGYYENLSDKKFTFYLDDEESFVFDIVTDTDTVYDLITMAEGEYVDSYDYANYLNGSPEGAKMLVLNGHGVASLYLLDAEGEPASAPEKTGTYAPGAGDLYTVTFAGEQPFNIKLSEKNIDLYFTYNEAYDASRISDDWSLVQLDGYGNFTTVDKYGNVSKGLFIQIEEGLLNLVDMSASGLTQFATVSNGTVTVLEGDYVVYNGTLYLYRGTSSVIDLSNKGITTVYSEAFSAVEDGFITSLNLTGVEVIQDGAFRGKLADSIEVFGLPSSITEVGDRAFAENGIYTFDLSEVNIAGATFGEDFCDAQYYLVKDLTQLNQTLANVGLTAIADQLFIKYNLEDPEGSSFIALNTLYTNLKDSAYGFMDYYLVKYVKAPVGWEMEVYSRYYINESNEVMLYSISDEEYTETKFDTSLTTQTFDSDFGFKADGTTEYTLTATDSKTLKFKLDVTYEYGEINNYAIKDVTYDNSELTPAPLFSNGYWYFTKEGTKYMVIVTSSSAYTIEEYEEFEVTVMDAYVFSFIKSTSFGYQITDLKAEGSIITNLQVTALDDTSWVVNFKQDEEPITYLVKLTPNDGNLSESTVDLALYGEFALNFLTDEYVVGVTIDGDAHLQALVSITKNGTKVEFTDASYEICEDFYSSNDVATFQINSVEFAFEFNYDDDFYVIYQRAYDYELVIEFGEDEQPDSPTYSITVKFSVEDRVATPVSATYDGQTATDLTKAAEIAGSSFSSLYYGFYLSNIEGKGFLIPKGSYYYAVKQDGTVSISGYEGYYIYLVTSGD